MKITDLNIDCIGAILDHLEFEDFINAADSNKRLNHAAKFIFEQKYKREFLFYVQSPSQRRMYNRSFYFSRSFLLTIYDFKLALQLIRCFGCLMNEITLLLSRSYVDEHLTSYLNEFCSDSITSLSRHSSLPEGLFNNFVKPFTGLEELLLCSYEGEKQFAGIDWINRLFPNMKKLTIRAKQCSALYTNGDILYHFPYLEHLTLVHRSHDDPWADVECICRENIVSTLKLNPQLKYFRSKYTTNIFDANVLQSAEESLQNLESLVMNVSRHNFYKNFNFKTIHLKNVKHLDVEFETFERGPNTEFTYEFITQSLDFPFSFDRLETLNFQTHLLDHFYVFIERNPTITTLGLYLQEGFTLGNCERLAKICPSVTKINIMKEASVSNFSTYRDIMAMFNSLKYVHFEISSDNPILQLIKDHFSEIWLVSMHKKHKNWQYCNTTYLIELKRAD